MATSKHNAKKEEPLSSAKSLRLFLREQEIADSIAAFARSLRKPNGQPYSRQSIYRVLKSPAELPLLHRKIRKALAA
jgi:hypothetical protein